MFDISSFAACPDYNARDGASNGTNQALIGPHRLSFFGGLPEATLMTIRWRSEIGVAPTFAALC
jgi:hypothetical protein